MMISKYRFGILALGLCLTGCISNGVDDRLTKLVGQDVQVIVPSLGPADGPPKMVGGDKVYVWTINQDIPMEVKSFRTSGVIGSGSGQGYESAISTTSIHIDCSIQLTTDQNDRIKSYEWSRDGSCTKYYSLALKPPKHTLCKADSSPRMAGICD